MPPKNKGKDKLNQSTVESVAFDDWTPTDPLEVAHNNKDSLVISQAMIGELMKSFDDEI